jgi:hypothetical protein
LRSPGHATVGTVQHGTTVTHDPGHGARGSRRPQGFNGAAGLRRPRRPRRGV